MSEEVEKTSIKKQSIQMRQSWHWLLYLDVVLPLLLFILALLPIEGLRQLFAKLFHGYQLYVMNPIPDVLHLMGIVGAAYHLFFLGIAIIKKRWLDVLLSLCITAFAIVWFVAELAWSVLRLLSFS